MSEPPGLDEPTQGPAGTPTKESGGRRKAPEPMYLANLVTDAVAGRGAPWLQKSLIDPETGLPVLNNRQSAFDLMNKPRKTFPARELFYALSALFLWEETYLRDACLRTVGIVIPVNGGSRFGAGLPAAVDELPEHRQRTHRDLIIAAVEDHTTIGRLSGEK